MRKLYSILINFEIFIIFIYALALNKSYDENEKSNKHVLSVDYSKIPKNYDLRATKRHCTFISYIRDQSSCNNSWAVAATSMMADRFCIATDGEFNEDLSTEELSRCCNKCKKPSGNGCDGGNVREALIYFVRHEIVIGSANSSTVGCPPYSVPPCPSDSDLIYGNSTCIDELKQSIKNSGGNQELDYKRDHRFNRDINLISEPNKEEKVQKELMEKGSCVTSMMLYDDFLNYKSGIYQHIDTSEYIGLQYVRLLGWGTENKTDYWLVANSWGKFWGENGFFKISRQNNGCEFGKEIFCPVPVL